MSILITFWNGDYVQFDECENIDFDYTLGILSICDGNGWHECLDDDIKEIIFVNDYTMSYAIEQGYEA